MKMCSLNMKVALVVVCALVAAVVIHSTVYLSIDAASLSAEMPNR